MPMSGRRRVDRRVQGLEIREHDTELLLGNSVIGIGKDSPAWTEGNGGNEELEDSDTCLAAPGDRPREGGD